MKLFADTPGAAERALQAWVILVGMAMVQDKWIASFHHDPMSAPNGFGSGTTPWRAVQDAAWAAVKTAA